MPKPTAYLETTVVSYLVARPSRDVVTTALQKMTKDWWENRRGSYELRVSDRVIREASVGDAEMVLQRLEKLRPIVALTASNNALALAKLIVTKTGIPSKAAEDAVHIAVAATYGIDYLVTWNCKHIANAHVIRRVGLLFAEQGLKCPVICTPQELMEDEP